jgi:hypothetical protein
MSERRTFPWELAAVHATAGRLLVDNPPPFHAKTLLVETKSGGQVPTGTFDQVGAVVVQFEGQGPNAWYARRFAVGAWGSVSLQVDQFRSFSLRILSNTLPNYSVVAMASDGDEASSQPLLLYPQTLTGGTGVVPWGATELVPAANDAGFSWEIGGVTVPVALTAGATFAVTGLRYTPTVFPFSAVWRIRP